MSKLKIKTTTPPWEMSNRLSSLLTPIGWLYGMAMEMRNYLYDLNVFKCHRLPVPAISIGNLTVGGTGKTPMTIEIARGWKKRHPTTHIGIILRGYRRTRHKGWIVSNGEQVLMGIKESGDEPQVIARHLKGAAIFVGSDRVSVGLRALTHFPLDLIILDDAFQHRRLYRDVDILLVDGKKGLGNGRVLPSGPLREFARNLKRATCLMVTHYTGTLPKNILDLCPSEMPIFKAHLKVSEVWEGSSGKTIPAEELKNQEVWGVCGTANPESFIETIGKLGVRIVGFTPFPDHHPYSSKDLERIAFQIAHHPVITTEKDWVKWEGHPLFERVYVVSIKTQILEEERFYDFLHRIVYNRK